MVEPNWRLLAATSFIGRARVVSLQFELIYYLISTNRMAKLGRLK